MSWASLRFLAGCSVFRSMQYPRMGTSDSDRCHSSVMRRTILWLVALSALLIRCFLLIEVGWLVNEYERSIRLCSGCLWPGRDRPREVSRTALVVGPPLDALAAPPTARSPLPTSGPGSRAPPQARWPSLCGH